MRVLVTGVAGTWGLRGGWWKDGSPFWDFMRLHEIEPCVLRFDGEGDAKHFEWETALGNSYKFWTWGKDYRRRNWLYAGEALSWFLDSLPLSDRNVIAHSHGGQVATACAARGVRLNRLLTVATPNRADMTDLYEQAAERIGRWHHVYDKDMDHVAWWGQFADGQVDPCRNRGIAQAHQNIALAGIGHSGLLNDPKLFPLFESEGLIELFRPSATPDRAA